MYTHAKLKIASLAALSALCGMANAYTFVDVPKQYLSVTASSVPPNIMLLVDTSGSMNWKNAIGKAKDQLKEVVGDQSIGAAYWGLARYGNPIFLGGKRFTGPYYSGNRSGVYYGTGGLIVKEFELLDPNDSNSYRRRLQALYNSIDSLDAFGTTPSTQAYYDVLRYYQGLYQPIKNGVSSIDTHQYGKQKPPVRLRCQKNYIIYVSDGQPESYENEYTRGPIWRTPAGSSREEIFYEVGVINRVGIQYAPKLRNGNYDYKNMKGSGNGFFGVDSSLISEEENKDPIYGSHVTGADTKIGNKLGNEFLCGTADPNLDHWRDCPCIWYRNCKMYSVVGLQHFIERAAQYDFVPESYTDDEGVRFGDAEPLKFKPGWEPANGIHGGKLLDLNTEMNILEERPDPEFKMQNIKTFTVGYGLNVDLLKSARAYGGKYIHASKDSANALADALKGILKTIKSEVAAGTVTKAQFPGTILRETTPDGVSFQHRSPQYVVNLALNLDKVGSDLRFYPLARESGSGLVSKPFDDNDFIRARYDTESAKTVISSFHQNLNRGSNQGMFLTDQNTFGWGNYWFFNQWRTNQAIVGNSSNFVADFWMTFKNSRSGGDNADLNSKVLALMRYPVHQWNRVRSRVHTDQSPTKASDVNNLYLGDVMGSNLTMTPKNVIAVGSNDGMVHLFRYDGGNLREGQAPSLRDLRSGGFKDIVQFVPGEGRLRDLSDRSGQQRAWNSEESLSDYDKNGQSTLRTRLLDTVDPNYGLDQHKNFVNGRLHWAGVPDNEIADDELLRRVDEANAKGKPLEYSVRYLDRLSGSAGEGGTGLFALNLENLPNLDRDSVNDFVLFDSANLGSLLAKGLTSGSNINAAWSQGTAQEYLKLSHIKDHSYATIGTVNNHTYSILSPSGYQYYGAPSLVAFDMGKGSKFDMYARFKTEKNAATGEVFDGETSTYGGMTRAAVVDLDRDNLADVAYVGTESGNLYRVCLKGAQKQGGGVQAYNPVKIFSGDRRHPITVSPLVLAQKRIFSKEQAEARERRLSFDSAAPGRHMAATQYYPLVIFGTGSQLYEQDNERDKKLAQNGGNHWVYGLKDVGATTTLLAAKAANGDDYELEGSTLKRPWRMSENGQKLADKAADLFAQECAKAPQTVAAQDRGKWAQMEYKSLGGTYYDKTIDRDSNGNYTGTETPVKKNISVLKLRSAGVANNSSLASGPLDDAKLREEFGVFNGNDDVNAGDFTGWRVKLDSERDKGAFIVANDMTMSDNTRAFVGGEGKDIWTASLYVPITRVELGSSGSSGSTQCSTPTSAKTRSYMLQMDARTGAKVDQQFRLFDRLEASDGGDSISTTNNRKGNMDVYGWSVNGQPSSLALSRNNWSIDSNGEFRDGDFYIPKKQFTNGPDAQYRDSHKDKGLTPGAADPLQDFDNPTASELGESGINRNPRFEMLMGHSAAIMDAAGGRVCDGSNSKACEELHLGSTGMAQQAYKHMCFDFNWDALDRDFGKETKGKDSLLWKKIQDLLNEKGLVTAEDTPADKHGGLKYLVPKPLPPFKALNPLQALVLKHDKDLEFMDKIAAETGFAGDAAKYGLKEYPVTICAKRKIKPTPVPAASGLLRRISHKVIPF